MFVYNGTHILLLVEKNVPPSPLICTIKMISCSSEIDQVFICYYLCHILSNKYFKVCSNEMMHESNIKIRSSTLHSNFSSQYYGSTSMNKNCYANQDYI